MSHRGNTAGHRAFKQVRPTLESLEDRLTPSGGGWISSTQSGQSGVGIFGQYYDNTSMSGTPSFTRWDNLVDFSASGGNADPGGATGPGFGAVGPGGWSARWTGLLTANLDESYTFSINTSGDGVRLWVTPVGQQPGGPLIDDWTGHGQVNDTATLSLQAGQVYAVEMDATQASSISQPLSLQWSSPSTPLEDIEPVTQVGLNVDGYDALFANLVNGGTRSSWTAVNGSPTVPTDSDFWPENDAQILLAEGDRATDLGGSYLVQFNGTATVNYNIGSADADWWVNGVDLHSRILQAGQGYDPATNTTTATMVVQPNGFAIMYLTFTNTCRDPDALSDVTSISETGTTVTVSLPSVAGIAPDQTATISGLAGDSAGYNGSFLVTGVNPQDNTFTFTDTNPYLPFGFSGGSARFAGNGLTDLYVMQPTTEGGSTPLPVGTLFTPSALGMAGQVTTLRLMGLESVNANLTSNWSDRTLVSSQFLEWCRVQFRSDRGRHRFESANDRGRAVGGPGGVGQRDRQRYLHQYSVECLHRLHRQSGQPVRLRQRWRQPLQQRPGGPDLEAARLQPQGLHRVFQRDLELRLPPGLEPRRRLDQPTEPARTLRLPDSQPQRPPVSRGRRRRIRRRGDPRVNRGRQQRE